ncbi:unnamed protein product [Caenorhabditis auriculariae]|uniref:Uncharacterized protein n=1 Tax=Caenorhabditis auriculariae TaxID=2777116 RepID=A0A8S1GW43_9PELO|nr:unnamed protein product [Caenorhabditis auriculariae]
MRVFSPLGLTLIFTNSIIFIVYNKPFGRNSKSPEPKTAALGRDNACGVCRHANSIVVVGPLQQPPPRLSNIHPFGEPLAGDMPAQATNFDVAPFQAHKTAKNIFAGTGTDLDATRTGLWHAAKNFRSSFSVSSSKDVEHHSPKRAAGSLDHSHHWRDLSDVWRSIFAGVAGRRHSRIPRRAPARPLVGLHSSRKKHVVAVGDFYDETRLHCMYKFDNSAELVIENTLNNIDEDGAAGESEHHRFWGWHKAILFFIITSEFLAFISICTGVCAPCFTPTAFAFTISLFIAMLCSLIADGVFFLAANRVDNRFVQGMVGTYEQRIGYAFYLHLMGTMCWIGAFVIALLTTYKFLSGEGTDGSKENLFTWQKQQPTTLSVTELPFRGNVQTIREEPLLEKYPPSSVYRPSPQVPYRTTSITQYRETSA